MKIGLVKETTLGAKEEPKNLLFKAMSVETKGLEFDRDEANDQ